jgi:transcriptional regulator of heat shock response
MKRTQKPDKVRKQILEDHREIGELLVKIVAAENAATIADHLQQLQPLLRRHFQEEETTITGLHAVIQERTPHFIHALHDLRHEHVKLLEGVSQLLAAAAAPGSDRAQLRTMGKELKDQLAVHEAKETDLFVDSIWTDLGEGD